MSCCLLFLCLGFQALNNMGCLSCRTAYEWVNPASVGLVVVTSSEGRNLPYGRLEDILSRDSSALNCHTNDDKRAWFAIDLGIWFLPSAYTLRHARGYGRSALRNWLFQVISSHRNYDIFNLVPLIIQDYLCNSQLR